MEVVHEYKQMEWDYQLSQAQKLQYLHNIFSNKRGLYLDQAEKYATNFLLAVEVIDRE